MWLEINIDIQGHFCKVLSFPPQLFQEAKYFLYQSMTKPIKNDSSYLHTHTHTLSHLYLICFENDLTFQKITKYK